MRAEWDAAVRRVCSAVLTVASSVLVATLIILSGMFLKWFLSLAMEPGSLVYGVAVYALDAIYVPCAVLWAASGLWAVIREAWASTKPPVGQAGQQ